MCSVRTESHMRFVVQPNCRVRFATAPGFGLAVLLWKGSGSMSRATTPAVSRSGTLSVPVGIGDTRERVKVARTTRVEMDAECMLMSPLTTGECRIDGNR